MEYVFREEVGPDLTVPYAQELIASDGATPARPEADAEGGEVR